jgi:peptide-methionine (R)-S-oxide reductase
MKISTSFFILSLIFINACGQKKNSEAVCIKNPHYSRTDTKKLSVSKSEWQKILPSVVYDVSRNAGTETPFSNDHIGNGKKGTFYCKVCGNLLFSSKAKFESGTGWPSFYEPINEKNVLVATDDSLGMSRDEVRCARCNGHLGHVFDDGPAPTGKRYCMNAIVLEFVADIK